MPLFRDTYALEPRLAPGTNKLVSRTIPLFKNKEDKKEISNSMPISNLYTRTYIICKNDPYILEKKKNQMWT